MADRPRRTQEERSAATRALLLDATIECLVERGYAGTTTTEIVKRAGVSRGAQVHHFPTKADLVAQAIVHLSRKRREELRHELEASRPNGDRVSLAVDLLAKSFSGPLFAAAMELVVAARTDAELRPAVRAVERESEEGIRELCLEVFGPDAIRRRSFRDALEMTIRLSAGISMANMMRGEGNDKELLAAWKRVARPLMIEEGSKARARH
ncbi:MAG: TetR/AcrR family transcriptional regulator [Actinomycetota bacterium]